MTSSPMRPLSESVSPPRTSARSAGPFAVKTSRHTSASSSHAPNTSRSNVSFDAVDAVLGDDFLDARVDRREPLVIGGEPQRPRLEQGDRADGLRVVERQLECHRAAVAPADRDRRFCIERA